LLESGAITQDETQAHFALRLSAGCAPLDAGLFLEGFLEKNAEIIAQDSALLGMIDAWLVSLDEERFVELLPLLRRALSSFDLHGRRALMQALARADTRVATHVRSEQGALSPAFAQALPLLYKILELRP
jgi:predicted exporter